MFEVAIGPAGNPWRFRVDVLTSPDGSTASALADLDIDGLLTRRTELAQSVLLSGISSRKVFPEEQRVRDVGRELFRVLLGTGEVAGRYRAATAVAAERGEGLRVVLRTADPALAALPWEAMYDESVGGYVCRREQLVRHVTVATRVPPLGVEPPLRILGIVSSPRDPDLDPLDVGKEQEQLSAALGPLIASGLAQLVWAPSATWADLQDELRTGTWHVVHFIGHGGFDSDLGEGVLALTAENSRTHLVEASRLIDLLRQARPTPPLVVLNSCSGGAAGATDLFSGTAAALVRGGFGAVAAMQYPISDRAAIAFARGFYGAIARGRGVDEAVSDGRTAIVGLSGRTLEWVTPVLYLRGAETHLFTVHPAARSGVSAAAPAPAGALPRPIETATRPARAETSAPSWPSGWTAVRHQHQGRGDEPFNAARPVRTFNAHRGGVLSVAFSPDGTLLASAGADHVIRQWRTATAAEVPLIAREAQRASLFSPNGEFTQVHVLRAPARVTFSPNGAWLASGWSDGTVVLFPTGTGPEPNAPSPTEPRVLTGRFGAVRDLAFRGDGKVLATAEANGVVTLRSISSQDASTFFPAPGVTGLAYIPLARDVTPNPLMSQLVTATNSGAVEVWSISTLLTHDYSVGGDASSIVVRMLTSRDAILLAFDAGDSTIRLRDAATQELIGEFNGDFTRVYSAAVTPDVRLFAAATDDQVTLWSTCGRGTRGEALAVLSGHDGDVLDVVFSPDGALLASAGADGTIRLWESARYVADDGL